jgi:ABC-type multidrug transport system fused ATPase/permease subunit
MILLLRAVTRLVTLVLLAVLSVCGSAIAIFSIGWSRTGDFNLPGLARLAHLGDLRDQVGELLHDLAGPGPVAAIAVLCGLGALAVGLLLLMGALWPRRERLVILDRGDEGTLAARRRALARVASALAEQTRGVTATKVRVRPGRWRGGRLAVRADHSRIQQPHDVRRHTQLARAPLTEAFGLRARVQPRLGKNRRRVD